MSLDQRVQDVRDQLLGLGAAAGGAVEEAAARLALALEPAIRLALQAALADTADALREQLRDVATVEVRLEGGEPILLAFPVAPPTPADSIDLPPTVGLPTSDAYGEPPASAGDAYGEPPAGEGDAAVARLTLRLPYNLKSRIEAAAATAGLSVNTWLTRAAERALPDSGQRRRSSNSLTGWIG